MTALFCLLGPGTAFLRAGIPVAKAWKLATAGMKYLPTFAVWTSGQHSDARLGNSNGVFEMGAWLSVDGDLCPAVGLLANVF